MNNLSINKTEEGIAWLVCRKASKGEYGVAPVVGHWYYFDKGNTANGYIGKVIEIVEGKQAVKCEKVFEVSEAMLRRASYMGKWYARVPACAK